MLRDKIRYLPGKDCAFFRLGRCLYEETLNPGFNSQWRCKIIVRLENEYDTFLHQAENFQLEEEAAHRIWERRLSRLLGTDCLCADFLPGEDADLPGCANAHGDVCLLALPGCGGKCRLFQPLCKYENEQDP